MTQGFFIRSRVFLKGFSQVHQGVFGGLETAKMTKIQVQEGDFEGFFKVISRTRTRIHAHIRAKGNPEVKNPSQVQMNLGGNPLLGSNHVLKNPSRKTPSLRARFAGGAR